ncbi:hypothetical protein QUB37_13245 [Microcoleus sp. AT3-A2]
MFSFFAIASRVTGANARGQWRVSVQSPQLALSAESGFSSSLCL